MNNKKITNKKAHRYISFDDKEMLREKSLKHKKMRRVSDYHIDAT